MAYTRSIIGFLKSVFVCALLYLLISMFIFSSYVDTWYIYTFNENLITDVNIINVLMHDLILFSIVFKYMLVMKESSLFYF